MKHILVLGSQHKNTNTQFTFQILIDVCVKAYDELLSKNEYRIGNDRYVVENKDKPKQRYESDYGEEEDDDDEDESYRKYSHSKLVNNVIRDVKNTRSLTIVLSNLLEKQVRVNGGNIRIVNQSKYKVDMSDFNKDVYNEVISIINPSSDITCATKFEDFGIKIDFNPYSDDIKLEIKEFIDSKLTHTIEKSNSDMKSQIEKLTSETDRKLKPIRDQIKSLEKDIERNERILQRSIKSLKISCESNKKQLIQSELDSLLTRIKYEKCPICTERTPPTDLVTMDCRHTACTTCYRNRYKLPEKGGMLPAGIILKCIGCENELSQKLYWNIFKSEESTLMFYIKESVKYMSFDPIALKNVLICICSQCNGSYVTEKSCSDKFIQTRCSVCISKDKNIKITPCSSEECEAILSLSDGCNVVKCTVCNKHTCFNCGERLGGSDGHDTKHFRETPDVTGMDIYFKNECCQGKGITSAKPTKKGSKASDKESKGQEVERVKEKKSKKPNEALEFAVIDLRVDY